MNVRVGSSQESRDESQEPERKTMNEFCFEKLIVWQKAIDFADFIYEMTQAFPAEEKYGLTP